MKTMTTWSSVGGVCMFLLIWMNTDLKFSNFYETKSIKKRFFRSRHLGETQAWHYGFLSEEKLITILTEITDIPNLHYNKL